MAQSPAELVKEKGANNIASALGMKPGTIRMWRKRDRIPRTVWPDLTEAFPDLDTPTLRAIEANGK